MKRPVETPVSLPEPDGVRVDLDPLAVAGPDGTLRVWELASGKTSFPYPLGE